MIKHASNIYLEGDDLIELKRLAAEALEVLPKLPAVAAASILMRLYSGSLSVFVWEFEGVANHNENSIELSLKEAQRVSATLVTIRESLIEPDIDMLSAMQDDMIKAKHNDTGVRISSSSKKEGMTRLPVYKMSSN